MNSYFHNSENVNESDFVISVEPFGMIDPVKMYETSRVTFSIRHKECLYQGINCKTSRPLGDVEVHFRFANEESWALEVCFLLYRKIFSNKNISTTTAFLINMSAIKYYLQLRNASVVFSRDDILQGKPKSVSVYGKIIGFNDLEVRKV